MISSYQWIEKVKKSEIMLYELEMKDNKNIRLTRVKENMVQLVVGILHLEKRQIDGLSDEKVSEQIVGSPMAFLAQVDDY